MRNLAMAEEIFALNQRKEYVLIAKPILNQVLKDKTIISPASKLWQHLYGKAAFNKDLSINISYTELYKTFDKSKNTLYRWVSSLEKRGYLTRKKNFKTTGGQTRNTFFISIPEDILEKAVLTRDRKNLDSGPSEIQNNKNNNISPRDIYVTPPRNTYVTPKDNNYLKDIKNNNTKNIVCNELEETAKEIQILEKEEVTLNHQKVIEEKKFTEILSLVAEKKKPLNEYYSQIREVEKLDISLRNLKNKKQKLLDQQETDRKQFSIRQDKTFMAKVRGNRSLSDITLYRLIKTLESIGYEGRALNILVNEITYEARFGSLTTAKDRYSPMGIEKSINIALKLVRENRWTTPTEMQRFCENIN